MRNMCGRTGAFVALVILVGCLNLVYNLPSWRAEDLTSFLVYLAFSIMAAGFKLRLPGVTGTISVCFFFVFIGIVSLPLPQALIAGCLAVCVQCLWHSKQAVRLIQLLFNVANTSIAITASYQIFHSSWLRSLRLELPVELIILGCIYFISTTVLVAAAIALTEGASIRIVWCTSYMWVFPHYLLAATTAGFFEIAKRYFGWQSSMLVIPAAYLVYRSYLVYLGRLDDATKHAENTAALHLRTVESLALAIEAKDHMTHDHLERVQTYAMEIGKDLRLSALEMQALRAASLLHDIGKIAVPEHIICKPGKLSPEEFDKMKIHPVVGAEILMRAQFPYPVVPIVRSHHEKWDGSGYAGGLKGEDIPIGARILAAVDCLDALASDRQYRRAFPLDKAMSMVAEQSGRAYDPQIVQILQKRYIELEHLAKSSQGGGFKLHTDIKVERGAAPDAGFEQSNHLAQSSEAQGNSAWSGSLGDLELVATTLSRTEVLALFTSRLQRTLTCEAVVIYTKRGSMLEAEHISGLHPGQFASRNIAVDRGLSGWVASTGRAILNGNPATEFAEEQGNAGAMRLKSALAAPIEGQHGVTGVLTLFRETADSFSPADLQSAMAAGGALAHLLQVNGRHEIKSRPAGTVPRQTTGSDWWARDQNFSVAEQGFDSIRC